MFDVMRVARGYVIATRCCVLQLCMRTACFNATKLSRLLVIAHANTDFFNYDIYFISSYKKRSPLQFKKPGIVVTLEKPDVS